MTIATWSPAGKTLLSSIWRSEDRGTRGGTPCSLVMPPGIVCGCQRIVSFTGRIFWSGRSAKRASYPSEAAAYVGGAQVLKERIQGSPSLIDMVMRASYKAAEGAGGLAAGVRRTEFAREHTGRPAKPACPSGPPMGRVGVLLRGGLFSAMLELPLM
jgi:hypothetical protein